LQARKRTRRIATRLRHFTCPPTILIKLRRAIERFRVEKLRILKLPYGIGLYSDFNGAALEKQQSGDSGEAAVGR
jgi:hypothetical protein